MRAIVRGSIACAVVLTVAQGAEAQQQVRMIQRSPVRADSLVARIYTSDVSEVKRLVTEWRDREQSLVTSLRATPESDFPARRRLEDELAEHVRKGFAMMSAIEARCMDGGGPMPAGYLGLNIESFGRLANGVMTNDSTIATSTSPGSPAERVGLRAGDKVITIGGVEPRRLGEIGELLVPGRTITVRVERDGAPKDLTLTVAPRPEGFGESCGELQRALMPMRIPGPGRMLLRDPRGGERRVIIEADSLEMHGPPEIGMQSFIFDVRPGFKMAIGYFAGAEFRALDADWQERLGVKEGVLVTQVATGSPAASSGLKGGDVVTAVGRTAVKGPTELVQALSSTEGSEVSLTVMRGRARRTITLKLGPR